MTTFLILVAVLAPAVDPVTTYGPWAILTGVIGTLWKLHLDGDTRDRAQRDVALAGWAAQREGNERLADVIEADRAEAHAWRVEVRAELKTIKQKLERKA